MKTITTILLLLCFNSVVLSQKRIIISFNDNINLGVVDKNTQFYITRDLEKVHLKGLAINCYKFGKPGTYQIKVVEKNKRNKEEEEEHSHLPKEITVDVSRIRMRFDSSKIKFSEPIRKNIDAKGITLSIPVTIETFDHQNAQLNVKPVNSAGIGTCVTATLKEAYKELPEGIHTIEYSLSGLVSENSYLMFDFIDANGNIQSISLVNPINN